MASPRCSTSKESLLPPGACSNQVQSEPSHCCICNKSYSTNIEKDANSDEANVEQSLIATLVECVSENQVNYYNPVNGTSLNCCNQCTILLENWRIFHNEERRFHVKAENLKAKLTAHILESPLTRKNAKDDGGFSHLDGLRKFVHQKYKCKVHVQMTHLDELRKLSIASKTGGSSRRQSIPMCKLQEGVLTCKQCPQRFSGSRAILAMRDHFQENHAGNQSGTNGDNLVTKSSTATPSHLNSPTNMKVKKADAAVQVDIEDFIEYLKKDEPKHDDADAEDSIDVDIKPDVTAPECCVASGSNQNTNVSEPEYNSTSVAANEYNNDLPEVAKKSSLDSTGIVVNNNPKEIWLDEVAPGKYNYGGYPVIFMDGKYSCCACWKDFAFKKSAFKHIELSHMGLNIQNVHVQNNGADRYMYRRQVPFLRKDGIYFCGLCSFHEEQKHSAQPSKTFFTHLSVEHLKNISTDPEERLVQCSDGGFTYSFLGVQVTSKDGVYTCSACVRSFAAKNACQRHIRSRHAPGLFRSCISAKRRLRPYKIQGFPVEIKGGSYICLTCSASFKGRLRKQQIMSHIIEAHRPPKTAPSKRTEIAATEVENNSSSRIPIKHFYFGVPVDVSDIGEYICGACSTSFRGQYAQFNCKTHIRHTHYRASESSLVPVISEEPQVILSVREAQRAAQAVVGMPPPEPQSLVELPSVARHDDVNELLKSLLTRRATMTSQNDSNNPMFLQRT